ncbi:hypothetical protein BT63DRAFT_427231 [Microthyrium microscopicum]|uniref:Uncharacterized protein n=1 Tax=Microthyrium microscopicum TaxID=703497 RepID=A0A6A6U6V5_9PEZI|nr:hypothetical protein BT63DRAFT_427231 [Microthyrium microscopicum]
MPLPSRRPTPILTKRPSLYIPYLLHPSHTYSPIQRSCVTAPTPPSQARTLSTNPAIPAEPQPQHPDYAATSRSLSENRCQTSTIAKY